jgi:hypothetical protein
MYSINGDTLPQRVDKNDILLHYELLKGHRKMGKIIYNTDKHINVFIQLKRMATGDTFLFYGEGAPMIKTDIFCPDPDEVICVNLLTGVHGRFNKHHDSMLPVDFELLRKNA